MKLSKRVMIYGGSYNPVHRGHINAALKASEYLKVDEVWLMPRKYNYDGSLLLDGKYRVDMLKIAIKDLPNFKICNVELKDDNRELIYTYNTAMLLKKRHKDYEFYFLIGADQLNNLPWWHEVDKLTNLFKFVCYRRPGYEVNLEVAKKYNVEIIEGVQYDASSTNVRAGLFSIIDDDVINYINRHQLYMKERVMPMLPEERFIHVLSTARLAKRIALALNVNTNSAYVAGILHDIAKGQSKDENYRIVLKHYPSKKNYPHYSYHAYASAYIAKKRFKITSKEIIKAIENHARPTKNMSKLEKIIYVADKIEETRQFASRTAYLRDLAFKDIDECFIKTMEDQLEYLKNNNMKIDNNLVEMIKFYKENKSL